MSIRYYIEKSYPLVLSIITTILIYYYNLFGTNFCQFIIDLSGNAMSVSVTLFGFLLTILTLINSIDTRRMNIIRDLGAFPRLLGYLKLSIILNLTVLVFSFFVKYAVHNDLNSIFVYNSNNLFYYLFLCTFIFSILASFRFTKLFIDTLSDN